MSVQLPFTNRTIELSLVSDALTDDEDKKTKLLVFHGKSGLGKTALKNEIARKVSSGEEGFDQVLLGSIDYDARRLSSSERMLQRLRNSFAATNWEFPIYDFAVLLNWAANYSDEAPPLTNSSSLVRVAAEGADDTAQTLADEGFQYLKGDVLKDIIEELPLARFIFKQGRRWFINPKNINRLRGLSEEMKIFYEKDGHTRKSADQLAGLLVTAFLGDLKRHQEKEKSKRILILADHLEAIFSVDSKEHSLIETSHLSLFNELVFGITNCVICIFSREPFEMDQQRKWRNGSLTSLKLKGLSKSDAQTALHALSNDHPQIITKLSKSVVDQLIRLSDDQPERSISSAELASAPATVDPQKLNWLANRLVSEPDTFLESLSENEESIWDDLQVRIARKRIQNLDGRKFDLIKHLLFLDGVSQQFLDAPLVRAHLGVSPSVVRALEAINIVDIKRQRIFVDAPTRFGILKLIDDAEIHFLKNNCIGALDQYLDTIASASASASEPELDDYKSIFHRITILQKERFGFHDAKWAEVKCQPLFDSGAYSYLYSFWRRALRDYGVEDEDKALMRLIALSEAGTCLRRLGQDTEAGQHFIDALAGRNGGPEMSMREAQVRTNAGDSMMALGRTEEAIDMFLSGLEFESDLSPKQNAAKLATFSNLAHAYYQNDQMEAASKCVEDAMDFADGDINPIQYHLGSLYNTQALIDFAQGDSKSAETNFKRALKCWTQEGALHVVGVSKTYQNYAYLLEEGDDLKRALQHYKNSIKLFEKHYLGDHLELAESYLGASQVLDALGDDNCVHHMENAIAMFSRLYQQSDDTVAKYQVDLKNLKRKYFGT
ncbi:MAG: tetratricopeptide repeat protein [Pseudomonadota bacterium]